MRLSDEQAACMPVVRMQRHSRKPISLQKSHNLTCATTHRPTAMSAGLFNEVGHEED